MLKIKSVTFWFCRAFVLPVIVLAYCNTKLIYILYISKRLQSNNTGKSYRVLNCTLIAIVVMFFICGFPSEFVHLFQEVVFKKEYSRNVILATNLLQLVDFSANFALYCIVNPYVGKTMKLWLLCCFRGTQGSSHSRNSRHSVTRFTEV